MRFARWAFVDRGTGRIVIGQMPNIPLAIFLVATIASRLLGESGAASVLSVVAVVALVVWAADEIIRGVNPWRRALGVLVLLGSIYMVVPR